MSTGASMQWESDLERAKERARDERRDVLLYFSKQP
jgi:hypothetical protein